MPGFDQTGPMGAGPMTGGTRGLCNPANAGCNPRFTEGSYGRGLGGRGLGLRRGFRGGFVPDRGRGFGRDYGWYPPGLAYPTSVSEEIDMLTADSDYMQKSLNVINKRIEELRKQSSVSS